MYSNCAASYSEKTSRPYISGTCGRVCLAASVHECAVPCEQGSSAQELDSRVVSSFQPALFGVDVNNKDRDWCCAAQELMSELHNTLGSSSAGRGNDDDSEDDDHEVTERLDRPAHADRPASAQHAEEGGEDDDESGEEEEEEGADARKLERGS